MIAPNDFIQEWIETVCSNDASKIANLYKEDAILLGTLDKSVRNLFPNVCQKYKTLFSCEPMNLEP